MIIEQLIFTFISFTIFVYMFFRMIKNNDTAYVIILILEAIGITLSKIFIVLFLLFYSKRLSYRLDSLLQLLSIFS